MNRKSPLQKTIGVGLVALTLALAGCVANEVPEESSSATSAESGSGSVVDDIVDTVVGDVDAEVGTDIGGAIGNDTPSLDACSVAGPQTFAPLSSPDVTVLTGKTGALDPVLLTPCADCSVTDPNAVIDGDPASAATMNIPQASTGRLFLQVNASQVVTAGSSVGFTLSRPAQTLSLDALQNVTIETYLGGSLQESITPLLSPAATLIDTLNNTDAKLLRFEAGQNFDQVRISVGAVNGVSPETLNVFAACLGAPNQP